MTRKINQLIVHCSATPNGRPVTVADITRWHRQRGFRTIGYHFVIGVDGIVNPGRPVDEAGAHALGYNANSLGICLVGGTDAKGKPDGGFAEVQFTALANLLHDLLVLHPGADVIGHRDLPGVAKACPSFDVRGWWKSHRPG